MSLEIRAPTLLALSALSMLMPCAQGRALDVRTASRDAAAPREITPRGELAGDEKATIDLFERSRTSVVFITTKQAVVDFWSRNVMTVPRGTGSGFIWDDAGHVVTNFHVIQGASDAFIKRVLSVTVRKWVLLGDRAPMSAR